MALCATTYALVVIFGSCSWLSVNSVWVELPLLVFDLPEKWTLPSYLAVIVQLACIGPLIYSVLEKCWKRRLRKGPIIAGFISFGCLCTILLSIFWSYEVWIIGQQRSLALFLLFFGLSLVNCTSNVLFLPYLASFNPAYMTAYFIGMGLSGLVPSILSLSQGAGKINCISTFNTTSNTTTVLPQQVSPNFSVGVFNLLMFFWMLLALTAFCLLHWGPGKKSRQTASVSEGNPPNSNNSNSQNGAKSSASVVDADTEEERRQLTDKGDSERARRSVFQNNSNQNSDNAQTETSPVMRSTEDPFHSNYNTNGDADVEIRTGGSDQMQNSRSHSPEHQLGERVMPLYEYVYLLLVTFWVCALMNGVLPSIQSYSCLPYGQTTYHLTVALSNIANPIACFIPFFVKVHRPVEVLSVVTVVASGLAAYILSLAVLSPKPFFSSSIVAWILEWGMLAYLRTCMAGKLHEAAGNSEQRLFWCGAFTQLGSFLGAIVMFPLINVWSVFQSAPSCPV